MPQLLDTHQHLIYPDKAGYAWTSGIPPLANQAFTVEDYLDLTKDSNIGGSLFMEAGVDDTDYQAETRFIADIASNADNNIIGIIASNRPETDDGYDAWLEECSELPVVGYRRILHVVDDDLSKSETFRKNIQKLGARDLTFDMCFSAAQLLVAVDLANAVENTQLILNHCGVPDIVGGKFENWRTSISALAEIPHVSCKISGVMAYCPPGTASLETIRPYLDHVVEAFGVDRLVWGSDWPVVNLANGVEDWISVTSEFLSALSDAEAEKIANLNASLIYKVNI